MGDNSYNEMTQFILGEISGVTQPAQSPALAAIQKNDGAENEPIQKIGDKVDALTSSSEGHQHGISLIETHDGLSFCVHYAALGPEQMHDHQIMRMPDGTLIMSENFGHTHEIDSEMMMELMVQALTKSSDAFSKQELTREVRERLAEEGLALPNGSFPIRNRGDLRNAISAFGRASAGERQAVANHIRRRARALDATDMIPTEGVLADLLKSEIASNNINNKDVDMTKIDLEKAQERASAAEAELAKIRAENSLTAKHREYYEKLDSTAASDFLKLNEAERTLLIARTEDIGKQKETENAEVVYKSLNGTEYTTAHDPALIEAIKSADQSNQELAKLRAERDLRQFEKRAESELQYLPGTLEVRTALLKAVDGIENENTRDEALKVLKAHNAKLAPGFTTVGTDMVPVIKSGSEQEQANAELNELTKKHAAEKGLDYYDAYDIVAKANPALLQKAIG